MKQEKDRKGEVVLFNMNGDYMIARLESIGIVDMNVKNLSQIIPVPSQSGTVTISIRPFFPAVFGLIKDPEDKVCPVRMSTVSVIFYQEELDPELVKSFLGQTTGLNIPQQGIIMPSMSLGSMSVVPEKKSVERGLPTGTDFRGLIGAGDDDTGEE